MYEPANVPLVQIRFSEVQSVGEVAVARLQAVTLAPSAIDHPHGRLQALGGVRHHDPEYPPVHV